jgi:hypothetical protein
VVAVLHQPRQESFAKFDDLLLLAPGGRTVYFGTAASTHIYFQRIGYKCGPTTSVADFVIDVIAGKAGAPLAAAAVSSADAADTVSEVIAADKESPAAAADVADALLSSFDPLPSGGDAFAIADSLVAQWNGPNGKAHRLALQEEEEVEGGRVGMQMQQQAAHSGKRIDSAADRRSINCS